MQAAYLVALGYNFIGSQADINIWNPFPNVELPDDFTTAQIWNKGSHGPDFFESVEAGWMVNPKLYHDKATRLFVYWTMDSYISTGCFDLMCPGFVQTSSRIALGAAFDPVSSTQGQQYHFNFEMFLDTNTQNWWLKVNHTELIGYWPASILGTLHYSAIIVEWGGQVYSPNVKKTPHTGTGMGSGDFASGLEGQACYMKNIRIRDFSLQLKYPPFVSTMAQEPYCYSALNYREGIVGEPTFFFGGPGRVSPYCP
ncbi:hypothetical protein RIF29_12594 [Crotalaria pallida]|uniref:Neprosin PEP catalytic domain-containing protein n=1 Tax=Crotalaria pallida TaxID=3830 RepID=A0AAN9INB5_CROPI